QEPARLVAVAVGADVDAPALARLGRDDPGELLTVAAVDHGLLRDPSQLVVEIHGSTLDSPTWPRRSPRARVISLRRSAQPTTAMRGCSRSARTRAGVGSWFRASPWGRTMWCSTSLPARRRWRSSSCGRRAAVSSAPT